MSAELLLVSWEKYFGRMGSLDGLFTCTQEQLDKAIGKFAYFGEVLGKHSDISCILAKEDFTIISNDQEKILWLQGVMRDNIISGYNPLEYVETEDEEDDDEDDDEDYQGEL